jgi:hypothetical protein
MEGAGKTKSPFWGQPVGTATWARFSKHGVQSKTFEEAYICNRRVWDDLWGKRIRVYGRLIRSRTRGWRGAHKRTIKDGPQKVETSICSFELGHKALELR